MVHNVNKDAKSLLQITDGTDTVTLLSPQAGYLLKEWTPAIASSKDGGVFQSSPLADGRNLVFRRFDNVIETFDLTLRDCTQDEAIAYTQSLRRLLEKALDYWTTTWQNEPVYLVSQAPHETNRRYALIYDYRTPTDDNPFAQPFFGTNAAMDEWTLILERGHWLSGVPGVGECMQVNGQTTATFGVSTTIDQGILDNLDDLSERNNVMVGGTTLTFGNQSGVSWDSVLRWPVALDQGTKIAHAEVSFTAAENRTEDTVRIRITAEASDNAARITGGYDDYASRPRTEASIQWQFTTDWVAGTAYDTVDLTPIIQEVIDRPNWKSGNYIQLFFEDDGSDSQARRVAASYDNVTYSEADIEIWTENSSTLHGHEDTCENEVQIANMWAVGQYSRNWLFDSGTGYTNITFSSVPFDLFPAVPATGDILYLGMRTDDPDTRFPHAAIFDLSQGFGTAVGISGGAVWEYYNGSWVTLDCKDTTIDVGSSVPLTKEGIGGIYFEIPSDMTSIAVNGITAYWIRLRITSTGAGTDQPPIQQNRRIYQPTNPFIDIDEDNIGGDIYALARLLLRNRSHDSTDAPNLYASRFYLGLRSQSRGAYFSAYLNCALNGVNQPPSITFTELGTSGGGATIAEATKYFAPAGVCVTVSGTFTERAVFRYYLDPKTYTGKFRAFLRYVQEAGASEDFTATLQYGAAESTSTIFTVDKPLDIDALDEVHIKEMGLIEFPVTENLAPGDFISSVELTIRLASTNASGEIALPDLILMPVDEWAGEVYAGSGDAFFLLADGYKLDIDGVGMPKKDRRTMVRRTTMPVESVVTLYQKIMSGPPMVQANADQRLWVLAVHDYGTSIKKSFTEVVHSAQMYKQQQYLGMRGEN